MSATYPDRLVAEARRAHGEGTLPAPTRRGRAVNPVCGDEIDLDVEDGAGRIVAIAHRVRGCAFTRGSAALLARAAEGMTLAAARELCRTLRDDLAGVGPLPSGLEALAEVRVYPARLRCALLPWDALRDALDRA